MFTILLPANFCHQFTVSSIKIKYKLLNSSIKKLNFQYMQLLNILLITANTLIMIIIKTVQVFSNYLTNPF